VAQLRDAGTTVLLVTHELDEAEVLCDRVVAMRGGRVLDQGPPTDLIARHAPWAMIRFGWMRPAVDELMAGVRVLPGVESVRSMSGRVEIRGTRESIAQVGAELVRRGSVPDDLSVEVPDLEAALLHLLDAPDDTSEIGPADRELAGANR
jgi:ABC-2 type transport system ATP-binding protein